MTSMSSVIVLIACCVTGGLGAQTSLRFKEQMAAAPKVASAVNLVAARAPAAAAPVPAFTGDMHYDDEKYNAESWGKEWQNGNFPGYKITNPLAVKMMDRQSDGKQSPVP